MLINKTSHQNAASISSQLKTCWCFIHHFPIDHNAPCLPPKILHNHCNYDLRFLVGRLKTAIPRRNWKKWLCKIMESKQGALWSMWKWWIWCFIRYQDSSPDPNGRHLLAFDQMNDWWVWEVVKKFALKTVAKKKCRKNITFSKLYMNGPQLLPSSGQNRGVFVNN